MRSILLVCLAAFSCVVAGGCKDSQVSTAINDVDAFTKELVKKMDSGNVDQAQKYLDERKNEISVKLTDIKDIRQFQVSEETMARLEKVITADVQSVVDAGTKLLVSSATDDAYRGKVKKLVDDYNSMITNSVK